MPVDAKRSAASKKAADTRAENKTKKLIADAKPADLSKYDGMSRDEIRAAKIAEIQQKDKSDAAAKATAKKASQSQAGKQAAATRQNVKEFKLQGKLQSIVSQVRQLSDDDAVKLLRQHIDG